MRVSSPVLRPHPASVCPPWGPGSESNMSPECQSRWTPGRSQGREEEGFLGTPGLGKTHGQAQLPALNRAEKGCGVRSLLCRV